MNSQAALSWLLYCHGPFNTRTFTLRWNGADFARRMLRISPWFVGESV
jgi:hypothetical protein